MAIAVKTQTSLAVLLLMIPPMAGSLQQPILENLFFGILSQEIRHLSRTLFGLSFQKTLMHWVSVAYFDQPMVCEVPVCWSIQQTSNQTSKHVLRMPFAGWYQMKNYNTFFQTKKHKDDKIRLICLAKIPQAINFTTFYNCYITYLTSFFFILVF